MTEKAIKMLQRSENGYFLFVEGKTLYMSIITAWIIAIVLIEAKQSTLFSAHQNNFNTHIPLEKYFVKVSLCCDLYNMGDLISLWNIV